MVKRKTRLFAAVPVVAVATFVAWPAPVDPLGWEPAPPAPLEGTLAPNDALSRARVIEVGAGPESLALSDDGAVVYGGLDDGRVIAMAEDGSTTTVAVTDGRPLGMELDAAGNLVTCDPRRGRLLSVSLDGRVDVLATEAGGEPIGFCNDIAVARDGRVYFSDASGKFKDGEYLFDLVEARPHGRLLRFDPESRRTEVLLDDLYFANGVALAPDESFVLVAETYRYRVRRLWLEGERAGSTDVLVDHLPGFPDNLTESGRGTYWLALFTLRKPVVDEVMHPRPWLKRLLAKLPGFLWPKPRDYALVVELDGEGRVLRSLHDEEGAHLRFVTSALERDGKLYLGTLTGRHIGVLDLQSR